MARFGHFNHFSSHSVNTPSRSPYLQFGLVSQNPTLFASSIFDNIALDSGATSEQVVAAAVAANAHGFICKLPNG